ncbi:MAG: aminotransferase class V-fold PLP-dependent enzyme [Rubrobacter sp.]
MNDPLGLDPETMRRLGYRTVDMLVDRLSTVADGPVIRRANRPDMEQRLTEPPPEAAQGFDEILGKLGTDVLPFASLTGHPRYFAFVPGCATWPGALGDLIASVSNIENSSWLESAGPSQLELVVLDWFKEWIGYPAEAEGVLVSGGSAANMTALACAREALLGAMSEQVVAYVSDQAHSSVARAARVLGFRPEQVRVLPTDARYRMRPEALVDAMDADLRAGRRPLFVVASAGSTNTGAIDPLPELAEICRDKGAWLHVDAAYGGFAALTERGRGWLAGIELADSVTLDPHKWLYQPFECGCLLVRAGHYLREAFEITPDYLKDTEVVAREVNFADRGVQLSRMCRALKVWMSLKYFGVAAFRAAIDRSLDLARGAQARIEASSELELLLPATLGIVCFRRRFGGVEDEDELARLNAGLVERLTESDVGHISSTRLRGRFALRMCILNHTTTARDVERVLDWIEHSPVPPAVSEEMPVVAFDRHPDVGQPSWLGRRQADVSELRALPLFRDLADGELALIAHSAYEGAAAPGDTIVRQWDLSREFYVVLDGTAEVLTEERHLAELGPGDYFGELAALDWGASFGYPRLASVIATSPVRLLVFPGASFNTLVRDVPGFGDEIRRAVRERLPGL